MGNILNFENQHGKDFALEIRVEELIYVQIYSMTKETKP